MSESIATPSFLLLLPPELRLQIYTLALDQTVGYRPQTYLSISSVSKKIRREVLPLILSGPSKHFPNLESLARWVARAPPHLLPLVSNLSIHIFQDSLMAITNAAAERRGHHVMDSRACETLLTTTAVEAEAEWWEEEYDARRAAPLPTSTPAVHEGNEPSPSWISTFLDSMTLCETKPKPEQVRDPRPIATAWKTFNAISELRKLWIIAKDGSHPSRPVRRFDVEQQLLFDMMGATFTRLQALTVFSNVLSLEYMRGFHDLRRLCFTGYATSTPAETAEILCSLKDLDTVIINRWPDFYDRDNSIDTSELPNYLSLTSDVIAKLNPLKEFRVRHMAFRVPPQHITVHVMNALRAHIDSLRSFSIHSDAPLDREVVHSITRFTASSRLSSLELSVISRQLINHLDLGTILPSTIKHGEASLEQAQNPSLEFEGFSYLKIKSSSSCLYHVEGEKICICVQQIIGSPPT